MRKSETLSGHHLTRWILIGVAITLWIGGDKNVCSAVFQQGSSSSPADLPPAIQQTPAPYLATPPPLSSSPAEQPNTASSLELSRKSQRELEVERRLAETPSEFSWKEAKWSDVREQLEQALETPILLDQSAIDDSLDDETKITFSMANVDAGTALRLMLMAHNATIRIDDGAIHIISRDVESDPEYFRTRLFDCDNLIRLLILAEDIQPGKKLVRWPTQNGLGGVQGGGVFHIPPQLGGGGGFGGGGGIGNSPSADEVTLPAGAKPEPVKVVYVPVTPSAQAGQQLIELIQNHVCPHSWVNSSGDGVITIQGQVMVVSQHERAIQQIKTLLQDHEHALRRIVANKGKKLE